MPGQKAQLNSLINSLRATGISQDLALPTVVVIGNQSSGKSSLLEAISCVNFPRASGTCTRVPTEVAMKRADTWQAQVSVRFEVDGQGRPLKKVKQLAFGEPLTDPTQVADMLRRAQLALLKNDQDIQKYFTIDIQAHNFPTTISFSPNPVLLDISGPDYVDLSLVDLPGIVQSGQDSDVALVKQIVESYIKSDTSIIVIAINMSDDLQNQAAVSIARKVDPNGHRTIGVLTKADRLEKGNELDWLKLLRGETDSRLSLGYFVTRQPTPEELASEISFVDVRKKEKDFYDTQQPWNHLYSERSRFGTPNIARFLSDQLTHAIHDQLPKLMDSITQAEEHTTLQLSKLPPPPAEDALHELYNICPISRMLSRTLSKAAPIESWYKALTRNGMHSSCVSENHVPSSFPAKVLWPKQIPKATSGCACTWMRSRHLLIRNWPGRCAWLLRPLWFLEVGETKVAFNVAGHSQFPVRQRVISL